YIAKKIQHIYFMSFEEVPALGKCEKLAVELLVIKEGGSCSL
nr:YugE family protein [Streptococcus vestibularis]